MDYQVLARKWRPHTFKDMVGQEHILRMLANALEQKRIHHAYLFTGTRGVGKTTLARILAKCLNCEGGITSTPCETCATCRAINAGQFLDLYEIDAASRTKVEDTRELLDNVMYPPTQGRYKVYLIDEVHMLSNHSFNALLKTLEEPPEHVKFLLATTDPKRLPITVLSRCLQFHLKRIAPEQIAKHLEHVCQTEKLNYDAAALAKLAAAADGSMRDALSLLDQAIAYGHGSVNLADVQSMLGSMSQDDLLPLLESLADNDGAQLFTSISLLAERAPDFQQVLEELINVFHRIAVTQIVPQSALQDSLAQQFSSRFSPEDIQLYYQIALLGRRDLSLSPSPQQGFEMAMLRMLAFAPQQQPVVAPMAAPAAISSVTPIREVASKPATTIANTTSSHDWRQILPKLELSGMAYALASNCVLHKLEGNRVELTLSAKHQPMLNQKLKERIAESLSRHLQQAVQLDITITTEEIETPVKQQQQENEQHLSNTKKSMLNDPKVKQLLEMYDATLEVSLA